MNTEMNYDTNQDDEVEDLTELLKTVLKNHPDVRGLSVFDLLIYLLKRRVFRCDILDISEESSGAYLFLVWC